MEKSQKNEDRIKEIEKELANKKEEKQNLEARFENEKQTFNATSELKIKIDELKTKANIAKRESKFEEAAKIEYGEIPALEAKIKENSEKWDRMQKREHFYEIV